MAAYYDEEDIGYMTDPAFWKMIRERRRPNEAMVSLEQVETELRVRERAEHDRSAMKTKTTKRTSGKGKRSNGIA